MNGYQMYQILQEIVQLLRRVEALEEKNAELVLMMAGLLNRVERVERGMREAVQAEGQVVDSVRGYGVGVGVEKEGHVV